MNNPEAIVLSPGADGFGVVYEIDGRIYRELASAAQQMYAGLLKDKILMNRLHNLGLVPTEVEPLEESPAQYRLHHYKIPYASYSIEWSFDMLKDAALLHVDLAAALATIGYGLKDAHPYNVLFDFSKPMFIDFSSIVQSTSRSWKGWKSGLFYEFVIPLYLSSKGWKRLAQLYFYWETYPRSKDRIGHLLNELWPGWNDIFEPEESHPPSISRVREYISTINMSHRSTQWEDYYDRAPRIALGDFSSYTAKERSALHFMNILRNEGQKSLLDVASNEGWFSRTGEMMGYDVVAFDNDWNSINRLYLSVKNSRKRVLPLVMDFLRPTRSHGINQVWKEATERLRCDVTLSMAIVHHLVLGQGISFSGFADRLSEFTKNFAIVEFIGKDDIHIRNRIGPKFSWYDEPGFLDAMSRHFDLVSWLPSEPETRKIFLFKRKR